MLIKSHAGNPYANLHIQYAAAVTGQRSCCWCWSVLDYLSLLTGSREKERETELLCPNRFKLSHTKHKAFTLWAIT